ncbi:tape measure protein [Rheinheimera gaetbuli]
MSKNLELALRIAASVTGDKDVLRMADSVRDVGDSAAEADPKTEALAKELDKLSNQSKLIKEFEQASQALDANTMAAYATAVQLDKLREEAKDSGKPFVELAKNIDVAEQQLEEMRKELGNQAANHDRLQRELKETGLDTSKLSNEKRRVQTEFKRASNDVRKLGNDYLRANGQQRSLSEGAKDLTSRFVALAGTYLGLNKITSAIRDIFNTGSDREKLTVQFNALMGSIEGGEKATEWVKQFTKDTPLQLEEVSRAFVRLKAFGLDPMDGTLQAITDQAFKLGGGFQEVEGISLALGQAWAKQKLQGEEILQLVERGVPVWDLLAKVTGKNTQELQKLSEQGKLGRDVIRDLMEEIGRQAKGSAAANMTLLSGLISNAKDNLAQFYNLVSSSGAMDWLKDQLAELNTEFAQMAADGRLQEWAQNVSDAIVSAGTFVRDTAGALYEFREEIGFVAKAWLALKVGSFLGNVVDGAKAAAIQLRILTTTTTATSGEMSKLALTTKNVFKAIGIGLLVEGVVWAVSKLAELKDAIFDLQAAQNALEKSQANLATTQRLLADEYESVSKSIGMQITSIDQLLEAERAGLVVYDEKLKAYRAVKNAAQALAETEADQVGQLQLTTAEAAAAAERILSMADAYKGAGDTAEGLNRQINAVLEVLRESNGEYATQIGQLEALAEQNRQVGAVYEQKQKLLKDTEQAYKALGITSVKTLEETAAKAQAAFEIITESSEPLEIQRQAFLKWAQAQLDAAKATGAVVPEVLNATAAKLGLSQALTDLTAKMQQSDAATSATGKQFSALEKDVNRVKSAVEQYRETLNSSTASSEAKALASARLADAEKSLLEKTELLNIARQFEIATYNQLQAKVDEYTKQLEGLDQLYVRGAITTEEYNQRKEKQVEILRVLRGMMGGLEQGEQTAGEQVDNTTQSLREQQETLDRVQQSTGKAIEYVNLMAVAQQYLQKEFDFTNKTAGDLGKRVGELSTFIVQNNRVTNVWWRDLAQASNEGFIREKQIIQETLAMRSYISELSNGIPTIQRLNAINKSLQYNFRQLSEQELAPLRNAISDAERRLLSLRDGLAGTVSSLRDELDRLNDNQDAIEQRRYQQQLTEIQAQLKQAQESGDKQAVASAEQALKLAKEIYAVKQAQLKEEQANQAAANAGNASTTAPTTAAARQTAQPTTPATTSTSATSASSTVRLELVLPGKTYNASMARTDAGSMLAEIERAASTSL